MSLDTCDKLSVKVTNNGFKCGSGIVYKRDDFLYVLTAKHNVCPKEKNDCGHKGRECNNCELINTYRVRPSHIKIEKPENPDFKKIKVEKVLSLKNKDLSILITKNNDKNNDKYKSLPNLTIADYSELKESDNYISTGYTNVTSNKVAVPVTFDLCTKKGNELFFRIASGISSNLETGITNMEGSSGMGVLHSSSSLLAGIYVKTDDFKGSYSEFIDDSVNELLINNDYHPLEFENKSTIIKNLITREFIDCFEEIEHDFHFSNSRKLEIYSAKIAGKKIEYSNLIERLSECIQLFCLPRKVIIELQKKKMNRKLLNEADSVFHRLEGDDKITDIMLQGLLEAKYNTPKLYSQFDDKNTNKTVHFKYIDGKEWEMIHCVSKFEPDIQKVFSDAISKLTDCVINLEDPSRLVSSSLYEGIFTDEEKEFLLSLLLPSESNIIKSKIHDTYAVLIGFEFDASGINLLKSQQEFKEDLIKKIKDTVSDSLLNLKEILESVNSIDAEIKLFFIPFKCISSFKKDLYEVL